MGKINLPTGGRKETKGPVKCGYVTGNTKGGFGLHQGWGDPKGKLPSEN